MAKFNMSLQKKEMPMQDPKKRAHNFEEVALGYTFEMSSFKSDSFVSK